MEDPEEMDDLYFGAVLVSIGTRIFSTARAWNGLMIISSLLDGKHSWGLGSLKKIPRAGCWQGSTGNMETVQGKNYSTNHSNNRYQMVSDHRAGSQWIRFFGWFCRTSCNMLQISGNTALSSVESDLYRASPMSLVNRWIGARICWWISHSGASCASLDDSKSPPWLGICSTIFHIAPFEVFGFVMPRKSFLGEIVDVLSSKLT